MKIAVNLASRPWIDMRPIYNRLRTWTMILALVGGAVWYLYRNESHEALAARAQVSTVENRVRDLESRQQGYRSMMQQPKDAGILQQSEFLNSLFQRKAFSWTATMTDLETVLPNGVQVLSIDPIVAQDGHVIIRLRVTGERDRELELVRNLEKSRHFASPRLASESLATVQGSAGTQTVSASAASQVNFDILADYRPLVLEAGGQEKPAGKELNKTSKPSKPNKPSDVHHPKKPGDASVSTKTPVKPGNAAGAHKTP